MKIKRDIYLEKLIDRKGNGLVKVITGPRRCGKSYLLFTLFKEHLQDKVIDSNHIIEAAFDDEEHEYLLDRHVLGNFVRDKIIDNKAWFPSN